MNPQLIGAGAIAALLLVGSGLAFTDTGNEIACGATSPIVDFCEGPPESPDPLLLTAEGSLDTGFFAVEKGTTCEKTNSISETTTTTEEGQIDIEDAGNRDFKFCQEFSGSMYESQVFTFDDFGVNDNLDKTVTLENDSGDTVSKTFIKSTTVVY